MLRAPRQGAPSAWPLGARIGHKAGAQPLSLRLTPVPSILLGRGTAAGIALSHGT